MNELDGQKMQSVINAEISKGRLVQGTDGEPHLTEQGMAHGILKVFGGQDLFNLTWAISQKIIKEGVVGIGPEELPRDVINSSLTRAIIHSVVKIIVDGLGDGVDNLDWRIFVTRMENEYLEGTGFFDKCPRAFTE